MDLKDIITNDLMNKISEDVSGAMLRTLALSSTKLPIAMSGCAAAVGITAAVLAALSGSYNSKLDPDPNNILLAALLAYRAGCGGKAPIGAAYKDFDILKKARRIPRTRAAAALSPQKDAGEL